MSDSTDEVDDIRSWEAGPWEAAGEDALLLNQPRATEAALFPPVREAVNAWVMAAAEIKMMACESFIFMGEGNGRRGSEGARSADKKGLGKGSPSAVATEPASTNHVIVMHSYGGIRRSKSIDDRPWTSARLLT
jgi:hypothetical protein